MRILILTLLLSIALPIDPLMFFVPQVDKELHMLSGFAWTAVVEQKRGYDEIESLVSCLTIATCKEIVDQCLGGSIDQDDIAWTMVGWLLCQITFKIEFDLPQMFGDVSYGEREEKRLELQKKYYEPYKEDSLY